MKGIREVWVRRPVLWGLAAYIAGLVLPGYFRPDPFTFRLGMAGILTAILLLALLYREKALFPVLLGLVLLFGWIRGGLFYRAENPLASYTGKRVTIQGTVIGDPQTDPDRAVYILDVDAVRTNDGVHPVKGKVRVGHYAGFSGVSDSFSADSSGSHPSESGSVDPEKGPFPEAFREGDRLQISGTLKEPTGPRNPKGFDYKGYLARRGITATMNVSGRDITFLQEDRSFSLSRLLARFRRQADASLDRSVGGGESALLKAMLLGQRWFIEPETEEDFGRTGLAHALSVSGLHVGYIIMLLNFLFSRLRLGRWTTLGLQTVILLLYALLVGAAPPVIRAVVMAIVYYTGKALGRKADTVNSAGLAALLILLIRPMDILEIGFQLSFLAVGSIALFYRPIREKLRFLPSGISSLLAVTVSAQLGTLPLTVYCFNTISPWSVLTNLVLLPVLGLATMGGFLLLPVGMLFPSAARILGFPVRLLCRLVLSVTGFAADLPFASIPVISPSIPAILVFYLVLWLLSKERPAFVKKPYAVCSVLICALVSGELIAAAVKPRALEVTFVDVGQGDCTFIRTPDGKTILIDGGGRENGNVGEDTVIPFLLKNGISSLDLVVMSHCHYDHIGGLIPVLEQLPAAAFMEYPPGQAEPAYLELKDIVRKKGMDVITAKRGQTYRVGKEVLLHILYPEDRVAESLAQGNENNYSLVILLEYRDTSVLFTGDIEGGVETYLTGRMGREEVDILKVPHHGSNTSSTAPFLDAVSPETGIIQVGTNLFGHPTSQTLDRLEQTGAEVYRNDSQGAVMMRYRDNQWKIRTMLDSP